MSETTGKKEMEKAYNPAAAEAKWYAFWLEKGYFTPKIDKTKRPWVCIMPPPNVTGALHQGHALFVGLEDAMTRYHRMLGEPTLWVPGSDHAGISGETVVVEESRSAVTSEVGSTALIIGAVAGLAVLAAVLLAVRQANRLASPLTDLAETAERLGSGDLTQVHRVLRRTTAWGVWFGILVGALVAALSGVLGIVFTGDAAIAALVQPALIVLAVAQPIAGVVFVLDGVLMGANDARYLAIAGGLNLGPFLPALWIIAATGIDGAVGLLWLAVAFFGVYLLARLATLGWRVRTDQWTRAAA